MSVAIGETGSKVLLFEGFVRRFPGASTRSPAVLATRPLKRAIQLRPGPFKGFRVGVGHLCHAPQLRFSPRKRRLTAHDLAQVTQDRDGHRSRFAVSRRPRDDHICPQKLRRPPNQGPARSRPKSHRRDRVARDLQDPQVVQLGQWHWDLRTGAPITPDCSHPNPTALHFRKHTIQRIQRRFIAMQCSRFQLRAEI